MANHNDERDELSDNDKAHKIESLRDMINNAEKTIQSAKAMLLQLEGKKKTGRRRKVDDSEGQVVEGVFDGQLMVGTDGKQYPVPANYASKSKLVEGDALKLTITPEGSFIYKQIGPVERKHALGIVSQDEAGNYFVIADGKPYRVLLASITYFKAEPGDEVAIVTARDIESSWCSVENIVQKGKETNLAKFDLKIPSSQKYDIDNDVEDWKKDIEDGPANSDTKPALSDEEIRKWTRDIEEIEKEIQSGEGA